MSQASNQSSSTVVCTVKSVTGQVVVLDKNGNVVRSIEKPGEKLYLGEVIKTSADSSVVLTQGSNEFTIGAGQTVPLSVDQNGSGLDSDPEIADLQKALIDGMDPSDMAATEAGVAASGSGSRSLLIIDFRPQGLEPGDSYPTFFEIYPRDVEEIYWIVPGVENPSISLDKEACAFSFHFQDQDLSRVSYAMHETMSKWYGEFDIDEIIARFCSGENEWLDLNLNNLPDAGEPILYTFKITNTGDVDLEYVVLEDNMAKLIFGFNDGLILGDGFSNGGDFSVITLGDLATQADAYAFGFYLLEQSDIDNGEKINKATVTGQSVNGTPVMDMDTEIVTLPQDPDIKIIKEGELDKDCELPREEVLSFSDEAYSCQCHIECVPVEGDYITYTFTVINTGNVTLENVVVTDPLIENIMLVDDGDGINGLSPNEVWTYTGQYQIEQEDIDAGFRDNKATVTGDTVNGQEVMDMDDERVILQQCPKLELIKDGEYVDSDDIDGLSAGDTLEYSFKVTNTGNVTISNVVINEDDFDLPGPIIITAPADTTLSPGEMQEWTGVYTLTQDDIDNIFKSYDQDVDNLASATGDDPAGNPVDSNQDQAEIPLEFVSSLMIVKDGEYVDSDDIDGLSAGDTLEYTFDVKNTGNVTVSNVMINEDDFDLPGPISITAPGDTTLAPGETKQWTGTYTLTQDDIDNTFDSYDQDVDNIASATGDDPAGSPVDSNQDPAEIPLEFVSSLMIVKDGEYVDSDDIDGLSAGDTLEYTFDVTNTGNVTVSNVMINEDDFDLPGPIAITPPGDTSLAPGETKQWTGTYTLTQDDIDNTFDSMDQDVDNIASATGDDPAGNPVDSNQDPAEIPLEFVSSLMIVKDGEYVDSDDIDGLSAGDTLEYTFDVTNTGNVTVTNVMINEDDFDLPGPISITPPGDTSLAPGETKQWTGTYTLTQDDIDNTFNSMDQDVDNIASATGEDPAGNPVDSNQDPAEIPLDVNAALMIVKDGEYVDSDDIMGLSAGDTLEYTFDVTNTGNVTVTNVTINEDNFDLPGPIAITPPGDTSLAPGETKQWTGTYTLTQDDIDNTFKSMDQDVDNIASATGDDPAGNPVDSNQDPAEILLNFNPAWSIMKTFDPDNSTGLNNNNEIVAAGNVVAYTIVLTNDGNVSIENVVLSDPLLVAPDGTLSAPVESISNNGILDVGETWTYTGTYTVQESDIENNGGGDGDIDNTATASTTTEGLDDIFDSAEVPIDTVPMNNDEMRFFIVEEEEESLMGNEDTSDFMGDAMAAALNDMEPDMFDIIQEFQIVDIQDLVDFGLDGLGLFKFVSLGDAEVALALMSLESQGDAVVDIEFASDNFANDTLIAKTADGDEVFKLQLFDNGATWDAQFTVLRQFDHEHIITEENVLQLDLSLFLIAEDGDGSMVNLDSNSLFAKVVDDIPFDLTPADAILANDGMDSTKQDLTFQPNVGADKAVEGESGGVVFIGQNGVLVTELQGSIGGGSLTTMTSGGETILLQGFGTNLLTGFVDGNDDGLFGDMSDIKVFDIMLDPFTDDLYMMTMYELIDNGGSVNFSNFEGVDSGKLDWVGLEDPRTGAADQNQDLLITPGSYEVESVNTSQVGGGAIGNGNQSVNPGETIRVDYVNDLVDTNFGSKDNQNNPIMFDGHYTVNNAGFKIVQINSGTMVDIMLTAYDEANEPANGMVAYDPLELTNDPLKPITSVTVLNAMGVAIVDNVTMDGTYNGVTVDFDMGFVMLTGIQVNYTILASTADGFERLEIKNNDPRHNGETFDVGEFVFEAEQSGEAVDLNFDILAQDYDLDASTGSFNVTLLPTIEGTDSGETLNGTDDAEVIRGNGGADTINAGGGNDIIDGGAGVDMLTGGAGSDTFVINNPADIDVITDYDTAEDTLDLSAVLSGYDPDGADPLSDYLQVTNNNVQVDADGGGDSFSVVATFSNPIASGPTSVITADAPVTVEVVVV